MGDEDRRPSRARVPPPYALEEKNISLITLKKWFNILKTYNQQNEEFLQFYEDGDHEQWTARSEDPTRGLLVEPANAVVANVAQNIVAADEITQAEATRRTRILRRDLNTLLNNYANYVPEYYYEMVLDDATSIQWIFEKLAESLNLQTDRQYILNSYSIQYSPDTGDTPEKLYMRLRGHYQLAAPKAGSTFAGRPVREDVKIGPLVELMLVEKTLARIDPRLPPHVVKTRGHLMEDGQQTLFCVRRLLWNQVDTMIAELDQANDNGHIGYVNSSRYDETKNKKGDYKQNRHSLNVRFQKQDKKKFYQSDKYLKDAKPTSVTDKICSRCFRAGEPQSRYMSHNFEECKSLSSAEKQRLLKAAVRLVQDDRSGDDVTAESDEHNDCQDSSQD